MEGLSRIKALRGILDLATAAEAAPAVAAAPAPLPAAAPPLTAAPTAPLVVPRFLIRPVELPLSRTTPYTPGERVVVITDDERGTAAALAAAIRERGGRALLLRHRSQPRPTGEDVLTADLADPERVAMVLGLGRPAHRPIGGLVHILPPGLDPDPRA